MFHWLCEKELWYYWIIKFYLIKEQLNLSVKIMNSIVDIVKIMFVSKSSLLSLSSRIFAIIELHPLEIFPLISFILWKRASLAQWWLGQLMKKKIVVSIFWLRVLKILSEFVKCLNACRNNASNFNALISCMS